MTVSITKYLANGPATSKELQAATGLSQPAISRQLRSMGDSIVKLPGGRSPRYAMTKNAFSADDRLPLYEVDAHGNSVAVALVRPLVPEGFLVQPLTGMPPVLLGDGGGGLYDGLPYFLDDLRPQGFLGRQIAGEMSEQSEDFPPDPRYWNTNHVGRFLVSNGDDLPGNFKFGQQTHLRVRRRPEVVSVQDYPDLADSVMNGVIPGSSAGGEHPKFTAYCEDIAAHVIVKFSPSGNEAIARRWKDILITEFHAAEVIHSRDFPAAETRLHEIDDRLFLESQRFDRSGEYGRMSTISLQAVDSEFVGLGNNWLNVMRALNKRELVSAQHVFDSEFLWCFGRMINNTDMHLGNLSLRIDGHVFRLLPVYDMCSMGFAPKSGEVPPFDFGMPDITTAGIDEGLIDEIRWIANEFWYNVRSDERISDEFRAFLDHSDLL
jgi:hypothetical protein